MSRRRSDYPMAETQPEAVIGHRGTSLADITLDAVLSGEVTMEDLRITPAALSAQAEIARDAGRPTLALNFERASELVSAGADALAVISDIFDAPDVQSRASAYSQLFGQAPDDIGNARNDDHDLTQ